jgi:ABC-type nickel/cobalt efflux system permease component RcnA
MPVLEFLTSSGFGSLLGIRHALEPDHLAAVSTLVSGERSSAKAALLGVCWGLGHTAGLVVVGAVLVFLRTELPVNIATLFELLVALMLITLGTRAIVRAVQQGRPQHVHHRSFAVHRHSGMPAHVHIGAWTLARRPLIVGAIHGLAGSGALTALVLTTLPSTGARLGYMALFGLGSTISMAALSGVLGWPLARLGSHEGFGRVVSLVVGAMSVVLGLSWGYPLVSRVLAGS